MLLEHMTRETLIDTVVSDVVATEAAKLHRSWLPSFEAVANHGRTGYMPALAGGVQA